MKATKYYTICLIMLSLLIQTDQLFGFEGRLKAGTGKVNITPKTGEPLHDSLYARSLVLDLNGERLAFVSVDLGIYTSENLGRFAKKNTGYLNLCSALPIHIQGQETAKALTLKIR
ncbi:MAG: hypothetical protein ABR927_16390 [Bacteroidales bacterium]